MSREHLLVEKLNDKIIVKDLGSTNGTFYLGEKINKLYQNLNKVNEGRSLKISSLNGLLSFLLNNISFPILVANIAGSIVYVSRTYCAKTGTERTSLMQKDIQEYIGEVRFADIVNTFEEIIEEALL